MLEGLSKAQKCSDLTIPLDTKPNAIKNRKKKLEKIQSKGWYWIEYMQETLYDSTTDKHQAYFEVGTFL